MQIERYDYLVIGSGLAGLAFALKASGFGSVCVLTKADIYDSNTNLAQGGIAAAVSEADSWELHERDTLIAGAGICDEAAVRFLVQQAPRAISWLVEMGARFDALGPEFDLGLEGGHSRHRIVHHADKTGWEIERAMVAASKSRNGITVYPYAFVSQLHLQGERCVGATAVIEGLGIKHFAAKGIMIATGGCGRMYRHTTNPRVATADGIALGASVGAQVKNMEFMQFHPTTLYHPQLRSFLISEALRGAGGTLRNHLGRRFMYDYDARLELAPRDVVARAIDEEMKKHGTWCVYLDMTHLSPELLRREFPMIYETLQGVGVAMEKDWIPVVPAQHYSCGGLVTDLHGRTTVKGLYAAGEVTCTGVHGGNRLASNSLLEALVFAHSAAASCESEVGLSDPSFNYSAPHCVTEGDSIRIRRVLQRTMTEGVGIVRTTEGLRTALGVIRNLAEEYDSLPSFPYSAHPIETRNLLTAADLVISGALARKENVGLHFNLDLASGVPRNTTAPLQSQLVALQNLEG